MFFEELSPLNPVALGVCLNAAVFYREVGSSNLFKTFVSNSRPSKNYVKNHPRKTIDINLVPSFDQHKPLFTIDIYTMNHWYWPWLKPLVSNHCLTDFGHDLSVQVLGRPEKGMAICRRAFDDAVGFNLGRGTRWCFSLRMFNYPTWQPWDIESSHVFTRNISS